MAPKQVFAQAIPGRKSTVIERIRIHISPTFGIRIRIKMSRISLAVFFTVFFRYTKVVFSCKKIGITGNGITQFVSYLNVLVVSGKIMNFIVLFGAKF